MARVKDMLEREDTRMFIRDSDGFRLQLRRNGPYAGFASLEELEEHCSRLSQTSGSQLGPLDLDAGSAANPTAMEIDPVENFYLLDAEQDTVISLAELPLDGEEEKRTLLLTSRHMTEKVEICAWKAEFGERLVLSVKDSQGGWRKLGTPQRLYEMDVGRGFFVLVHFFYLVERAKEAPETDIWNRLRDRFIDRKFVPCEQDALGHTDILQKLLRLHPELETAPAVVALLRKRKRGDELLDGNKKPKTSDRSEKEEPDSGQTVEEVNDDNELGESVCAICDDGGSLICCDGPCLRSFHKTKSVFCVSLGIPEDDEKQNFFCENCAQHQHQCFKCGELGSSEGPSQEVFPCVTSLCGKFYHRSCVSELLGRKIEGDFTCPLHFCHKCNGGEGENGLGWLYKCRRCPRAWHRDCAGSRIKFSGEEQRGWVIGKTRFLYCQLHPLDPVLRTPKRDHLKFPHKLSSTPNTSETYKSEEGTDDEVVKEHNVPANLAKRVLPNRTSCASKSDVKDTVVSIIRDSEKIVTADTVLQQLKLPKNCEYAPSKSFQLNRLSSLLKAFDKANESVQAGGRVEDARRIFPPADAKLLKNSTDALRVFLAPVLYGTRYSHDRHFLTPEKLEKIIDKLCWYVCHGDTVADLCCGDNAFSRILARKLGDMKKRCRYKNYDYSQPNDTFCFENKHYTEVSKRELGQGSQLIIGLNPPFDSATEFAEVAASLQPKIIILVAPKEIKRLEELGYVLTWEDKELLRGEAFYVPGSLDVNGNPKSEANDDGPLLFFWSRADWKESHRMIALERGHVHVQNATSPSCNVEDVLSVEGADKQEASSVLRDVASDKRMEANGTVPNGSDDNVIDMEVDDHEPSIKQQPKERTEPAVNSSSVRTQATVQPEGTVHIAAEATGSKPRIRRQRFKRDSEGLSVKKETEMDDPQSQVSPSTAQQLRERTGLAVHTSTAQPLNESTEATGSLRKRRQRFQRWDSIKKELVEEVPERKTNLENENEFVRENADQSKDTSVVKQTPGLERRSDNSRHVHDENNINGDERRGRNTGNAVSSRSEKPKVVGAGANFKPDNNKDRSGSRDKVFGDAERHSNKADGRRTSSGDESRDRETARGEINRRSSESFRPDDNKEIQERSRLGSESRKNVFGQGENFNRRTENSRHGNVKETPALVIKDEKRESNALVIRDKKQEKESFRRSGSSRVDNRNDQERGRSGHESRDERRTTGGNNRNDQERGRSGHESRDERRTTGGNSRNERDTQRSFPYERDTQRSKGDERVIRTGHRHSSCTNNRDNRTRDDRGETRHTSLSRTESRNNDDQRNTRPDNSRALIIPPGESDRHERQRDRDESSGIILRRHEAAERSRGGTPEAPFSTREAAGRSGYPITSTSLSTIPPPGPDVEMHRRSSVYYYPAEPVIVQQTTTYYYYPDQAHIFRPEVLPPPPPQYHSVVPTQYPHYHPSLPPPPSWPPHSRQ